MRIRVPRRRELAALCELCLRSSEAFHMTVNSVCVPCGSEPELAQSLQLRKFNGMLLHGKTCVQRTPARAGSQRFFNSASGTPAMTDIAVCSA